MNELSETQVKQEALSVEEQANALVVNSNEGYNTAAAFLKQIKTAKKKVTEYWKPAKDAAAKTHKEICQKEKAMTSVCDNAEKTIKAKMLTYSQKVEAERRATEEAAEKAKKEEADRLLAEAANAEKSGDTMQANVNMSMAEQVESVTPTVQVATPKVTGVSTKKVWAARVTDAEQVPAYINGFCIRQIDGRAIMQIRKLNPNIKIPGIEFYQKTQIAVR